MRSVIILYNLSTDYSFSPPVLHPHSHYGFLFSQFSILVDHCSCINDVPLGGHCIRASTKDRSVCLTASLVAHEEVSLHVEWLSQHEDFLRFSREDWFLELIEVLGSHGLVLERLLEAESAIGLSSEKVLSLLSFLLFSIFLFLLLVCLSVQEVLDFVEDSKWAWLLSFGSAALGAILFSLVGIDQAIWVL